MSNYSSSIAKLTNKAIYKSYGWMCIGLTFTAIISYMISMIPAVQNIIFGSFLLPLLIIFSQIGIIAAMGSMIKRISYFSMVSLFMLYSFLNGLTLSILFKIFELDSIIGIFFVTAGISGVMSLYGLFTKSNLNSFGIFGIATLSGVLVFSILNIFIKSIKLDFYMSFFAVVAIAALIAYDSQRTKEILMEFAYDNQQQKKMSIFAALNMYINFISLFLRLLHMFGKRKD